jgi:hypothetical protein
LRFWLLIRNVGKIRRMNSRIPLAGLAVELSDLTGATPPTYRRLNTLAADGVIRTEKVGRLHFVRREDLQAIAIKLGMLTPETANSSRAPSASTVEHIAA